MLPICTLINNALPHNKIRILFSKFLKLENYCQSFFTRRMPRRRPKRKTCLDEERADRLCVSITRAVLWKYSHGRISANNHFKVFPYGSFLSKYFGLVSWMRLVIRQGKKGLETAFPQPNTPLSPFFPFLSGHHFTHLSPIFAPQYLLPALDKIPLVKTWTKACTVYGMF